MGRPPGRYENIVGLILIACLATGLAGLFVSFWAFLSGDTIDAGVALMAAALAFGLALNAILRQ
jgi:hypothetical protein